MNNKIAKIDMLLLLKSHHEITKKNLSSEIFTLSKMNFSPLSSFICFSHRNVGDYFENQCTLKFVFHFFVKTEKIYLNYGGYLRFIS